MPHPDPDTLLLWQALGRRLGADPALMSAAARGAAVGGDPLDVAAKLFARRRINTLLHELGFAHGQLAAVDELANELRAMLVDFGTGLEAIGTDRTSNFHTRLRAILDRRMVTAHIEDAGTTVETVTIGAKSAELDDRLRTELVGDVDAPMGPLGAQQRDAEWDGAECLRRGALPGCSFPHGHNGPCSEDDNCEACGRDAEECVCSVEATRGL